MADIIRLNGDPHAQTQHLLPWYVTGVLGDEEQARIEGGQAVPRKPPLFSRRIPIGWAVAAQAAVLAIVVLIMTFARVCLR